ncbi:hypothetical protein [Polynucleobacter rarus]|uniref:hypothetical protein n=1 Tax=Polynucleobacter rarus TaxID=556055 RepID=UPI00131F1BC3|nr:hypothetical protein [Polynucleobacter rarus]
MIRVLELIRHAFVGNMPIVLYLPALWKALLAMGAVYTYFVSGTSTANKEI